MTNPHGTPIWYELVSADPPASKAFYDHVIGWTIGEPMPEMDYRMIETGNGGIGGAIGGAVGGVMRLSPEMQAGGAKPGWLFYIGVDDVDATAAAITAAGGAVHMGPWSMPGVGCMAVVADPQGIPFYIMRGNSDADSTAYDRTGMGKCNWNELITPDQDAGDAFYRAVFGWSYPDVMPMGPLGEYRFFAVGDTTIGATMRHDGAEPAPGWRFYFRAPDIVAAAAKVAEAGGSVLYGPAEVPGGDRIIVASDPHGLVFGVVASGAGA
ncbi:VOC family protein [Sphingomonas glacialis]|uniref:VOC family protein n=1 Tax=Sphingomonas glacialis TaxID=658225 RepID=A0A502G4M7_9SPHN|nr:VOC family protein [Sphingomonas glacialis]TPG56420.1 VOC family protein [Sphingomonas glacialis]